MKGLCLLVVAVIVLVQVNAKPDPFLAKALKALETTTLVNNLKRSLNVEDRSTGGCPLARFHNNLNKKAKRSGPNVHDLRETINILKKAGFDNEIRSSTILEEFARQTGDICQSETNVQCDAAAKYRTADGSCNNLEHPFWGSAGVEQTRVLSASYDDPADFDSTRNKSVNASNILPNPRDISNAVHATKGPEVFSTVNNAQVFQMGQFLDHDITATPTQTDVSDCCANANDAANCIPIYVQANERKTNFFSQGYCMNMQRSDPSGCDTDTRQQKNDITSFVDASNVYGSSDTETNALRAVNASGALLAKLKVEDERLPIDTNNPHCTDNGVVTNCSKAGDHRANVVPSLASYHYLFVKEHNRLVDLLQAEFSSEEELFQEARRLLIAIMQDIVYNEFLPSILSESDMDKYNLASSANYGYNVEVNPTMMNVFGIGYRLGHTWIPRKMEIFNTSYGKVRGRNTDDSYFDLELYNALVRSRTLPGPDGLVMWLTGDPVTRTDELAEEDVRSFLFQDKTAKTAFDLMALNIQRGRDHGIPSYTAYRAWCRGESSDSNVTSFSQLDDINQAVQEKLESVYSDPRDIDLFTGLMSEEVIGDKFGPTVGCILGEQFNRLKFGDRFWYENQDTSTATHPFTDGQITAIENYSFSKLLCNNYDYTEVDSPNAFAFNNNRTPCDEINDIDIGQFLSSSPSVRGNKREKTLEVLLEEKELAVLETILDTIQDDDK